MRPSFSLQKASYFDATTIDLALVLRVDTQAVSNPLFSQVIDDQPRHYPASLPFLHLLHS